MTQLIYQAKYKQVKHRLKQLMEMRHDAVAQDIASLKNKIQEHQNAHAITVHEIKQEIELLKKEIEDVAQKRNVNLNLNISNSALKSNLKLHDAILSKVLNYNYINIKCIGQNEYRISCSGNDIFIGELAKQDNEIIYRPVKVPQSARFTSFRNICIVENLNEFCRFLYLAVYQ